MCLNKKLKMGTSVMVVPHASVSHIILFMVLILVSLFTKFVTKMIDAITILINLQGYTNVQLSMIFTY